MSRDEIIRQLQSILIKYGIDTGTTDECQKIETMEIDELSKVQIAMDVERIFKVEFDLECIYELGEVKDVVDYIQKHLS